LLGTPRGAIFFALRQVTKIVRSQKQEWNRISASGLFGLARGCHFPLDSIPDSNLHNAGRETIAYSSIQTFDELPIPFRCVATDLLSGDAFVLQEGSLPKRCVPRCLFL
jgi:predicted acylesterase/phospholipase RssA